MKKASTLVAALSLVFSYANADLEDIRSPDGRTIWDLAPDFRNDPIQPFPDLKDPDGKNLTTENIRGVHLFGFKGCTNHEGNDIKVAYNDFYKLAQQPELYKSINWSDPVPKIMQRRPVFLNSPQILEICFETASSNFSGTNRSLKTFSVPIAPAIRYLMEHAPRYNVGSL